MVISADWNAEKKILFLDYDRNLEVYYTGFSVVPSEKGLYYFLLDLKSFSLVFWHISLIFIYALVSLDTTFIVEGFPSG